MSVDALQSFKIGEPINLALDIFGPLSSVPGSPSIFYLQPLLSGRIHLSTGLLIGAELFLFLAQHLFRLEGVPILHHGENTVNSFINIPILELQELLGSISKFSRNDNETGLGNQVPEVNSSNTPNQSLGAFLTTQTPEIPLVVGLSIYTDYSNTPFSPIAFITIPIFTLPGIRGALPLLILATLETILVRSVVPPETTGSKPLKPKTQDNKFYKFSSEDLLSLLNRFGKHFSSQ